MATNSSRYSYIPSTLTNYKMLEDRALNMKKSVGYSDKIAKKIYTNMDSYQADPLHKYVANQGAIFNLEFSLDGRVLVGACEEKSVLIFDAANQKQVKMIKEAHYGCVNCVRFLGENTFATCSDDNTVKIWDLRQLKAAKRTLQGHSNWVKNIEYIEKDQTMITSAFDGSIYAWDLRSPTENNLLYNSVFKMNGLMRTKLTPDGTKMIICTTSGYMILIHNLNLETLSYDLRSFRPNLYRLMQTSGETFPAIINCYNHLFSQNRKHNRLEFIDDFPNEAEVISSLQIHPMGWVSLSRNINAEENEEWTAVHDIQTRDPNDYRDAYTLADPYSDVEEDEISIDEIYNETDLNPRPADIWMGFATNEDIHLYRTLNSSVPEDNNVNLRVTHSGIITHNQFRRPRARELEHRIIQNIPRLTHFVKEKSVGEGYIKELCFSSDGRIICSPFDKGVRLLGFDQHMQELCYCVPTQAKALYTIAELNNYHPDVVVSCKFNPMHYQMVSGCLGGNIVWYKPIL